MKTIGIFIKRKESRAAQAAAVLIDRLRKDGHRVFYEKEARPAIGLPGAVKKEAMIPKADLVVVLGGDGTMLAAARAIGGRRIPILGCNLGRMGFLTEVTLVELYPLLERYFSGNAELYKRMTLRVRVKGVSGNRKVYRVLNDVVVAKRSIARIVELSLFIDDREVNRYRGDGLIVATPTGSTAYSLSTGGPIVLPSHHCVIVTPLAPHSLTNRPILFPPDARLRLSAQAPAPDVFVTLDGQEGFPLPRGCSVEVTRDPKDLLLVKNPHRDFYDVLRSKLRWGEQ